MIHFKQTKSSLGVGGKPTRLTHPACSWSQQMLPSNCNTWFARPLLIRRFFLNTCIRLQIVFSPLQWQSLPPGADGKIQATLQSTASLSCVLVLSFPWHLLVSASDIIPGHHVSLFCLHRVRGILARCCNYLGHWCGCYKKNHLTKFGTLLHSCLAFKSKGCFCFTQVWMDGQAQTACSVPLGTQSQCAF